VAAASVIAVLAPRPRWRASDLALWNPGCQIRHRKIIREDLKYLLDRKRFRSLSTGEVIKRDRKSDRDWRKFSFPTRWHYDVLWGPDYLRKAAAGPDERVAQAIDLVATKQHQNGRWPLDIPHAGKVHFDMEGRRGTASRWNTVRSLRVLRWYSAQG